MKNLLSSTRNRVIAIVIAVLVVLVAAFFGLFAYFQNHALPGSQVAGISVAGKTPEQVTQQVTQAVDSQEVTVQIGDQTETVPLADTGVTVDVAATVDQVFAAGKSPISMIGGLFGTKDVAPITSVDSQTLNQFANKLPLPEGSAAVDAEVTYDAGSQTFQVTEGRSGEEVNLASLEKALVTEAQSLNSASLTVDTVQAEPAVSTESAQSAASQATSWLAVPLSVSDGVDTVEEPSADTRAEWVTFSPEGDQMKVAIDSEKVKKWVDEVAAETNEAPVTGKRNVYSNGEVAATSVEAESGWVASNSQAISDQFVSSLDKQEAVAAVFEYKEEEGTWEDRPVASGSENLVYKPAEGEKWIDLNLSNSTVTAYEGSKVVNGPFYMVPGAPETPTIAGEFNIYLKYETQTMRGENADGSKYETPDVPWVSYFSGGYGFHGAPWRSSFGWSGAGGSHGCINMPVEDAKYIYDWADMGTKVISHY